jgi:ATP-dependent DNA helicase RecQ
MNEDLLRKLPDKFPDYFTTTADGKIALQVLDGPEPDEVPEPATEPDWWQHVEIPTGLAKDDVVVLAGTSVSLGVGLQELEQLAVINLGTGEPLLEAVVGQNGETVITALGRLQEALAGASAVAGHDIQHSLLPFLERTARGHDIDLDVDLPVLDLLVLSLLVEPDLVERSLADLADSSGIGWPPTQGAVEKARIVAKVTDKLLARIEPDDPSWALTHRLLVQGEQPWARLLPVGETPETLKDVLRPEIDPLIAASGADRPGLAMTAVQQGFEKLREHGADADRPYREREGQSQMAKHVAASIDDGLNLAVEAPTGTGKTLAYMLPAAAASPSQPVVVATATKVLQRQLREEAKYLRRIGLLPVPFRQVQGVQNYLCTREVADTIETRDAEGSEWLALAVAVRGLTATENGVWEDVSDWEIRHPDLAYGRRRHQLRATSNTCEKSECEWYRNCPLFGQLTGVEANPGIISVSHSLLAAWSKLANDDRKAPGDAFAQGRSSLIIDEAHQLEDTMTSAWTEHLGSYDLAVTLGALWGRRGPIRRAEKFAKAAEVGDEPLRELRRLRRAYPGILEILSDAVEAYMHEYAGSETSIELRSGVVNRRPEFLALSAAAFDTRYLFGQLQARLIDLGDELRQSSDAPEGNDGPTRRAVFRLSATVEDLNRPKELLETLCGLQQPHQFVHLLSFDPEVDDDQFEWRYDFVPVDIGDLFRDQIVDRSHTTVLTSATLTVGDRFDFIADRLGITIADDDHKSPENSEADTVLGKPFRSLRVESPFDYNTNSAVVLTSHLQLPLPAYQRQYCEEVAADQVGFLSLAGGRTLGLFAARVRMEEIAAGVRQYAAQLAALPTKVKLLVQGEDSEAQIAKDFKENKGTVVYGLRKYWTGFDAPTETLSYLVIEKPPYPPPSDPIVAARQRAIADAGQDPFVDYIVPKTAIAMAQGFGRLLRTETDRGAALILDKRLQQPSPANYTLLETLPTDTKFFTSNREEAWSKAIEFVTGEPVNLEEAIHIAASEVDELLEQFCLEPGENPIYKLEAAASKLFKIDQLYPEQLQLMQAVLAGHDTLGFLPTGMGKSICFQLPALLNPQQHPTVVVSPLIALIKDQVDELRSHLGFKGVVGLTGQATIAEKTESIRDLAEGRIRLLYVSPERLVNDPGLQGALANLTLGCLVVDEAHCVSSWGHDFRPEFRQIAKAVLEFERSPRLGLTATATPDVEADIIETLEMENLVIVRKPVDRLDLRWWVTECGTERSRDTELRKFIKGHGNQPGIVYASRRALTEQIAWGLRQVGYQARSYHAGLLGEQRTAIQDDFLEGTTQIVVATKAFGMGVNKPDIGWVVHYDIPESLEAYAQEAGRAARSPEIEGDCLLLWGMGDLARRRKLFRLNEPFQDPRIAQRALGWIASCPKRGDDYLIDYEEMAADINLEPDDINRLIAWLERTRNVYRLPDCTNTGMLSVGHREPEDREERRQFHSLVHQRLNALPGTKRRIVLSELADQAGVSPDQLEKKLIEWTLNRWVTFNTSSRFWRIRLDNNQLDAEAYSTIGHRWSQEQSRRFDAMANYATEAICRRKQISEVFGDQGQTCIELNNPIRCDICSGGDGFLDGQGPENVGGGGEPPWAGVPDFDVPDPEESIDPELVVLMAVRWACSFEGGRYGKGSLSFALLGQDTFPNGRPLGDGWLRCPQFGALKFLRNPQDRFDRAISSLIDRGAIEEETVERDGHEPYVSLTITQIGRALLGRRHG